MEATKSRIWKYYNMGLTCPEIARLMDLSTRTVQRSLKEVKKDAQPRPIKARELKALELHRTGYSYTEIARRLKVSKTTVYLWHRKHAKVSSNTDVKQL
jgi:transposase